METTWIRPGSRGLFFGYKGLPRIVFGIIRPAQGPERLDHIVTQIVLPNGIGSDGHPWKRIAAATRVTLMRLATRWIVRRIMDEPDTCRALVWFGLGPIWGE